MTDDAVIVCTVENLSMTGANPVEILLMKTFFRGLIAQIARLLPVDDAFAIRFA